MEAKEGLSLAAEPRPRVLLLGIGNVLMGDEGVGVHVVRHAEQRGLPEGCVGLDGGTGSLTLLEPMQRAGSVLLVDATLDGSPPGTLRRLRPRFSTDYPRTLTAHDIGLKDLLDVFYLLGEEPDVTLFAVSIEPPEGLDLELSERMAARVPEIAGRVLEEAERRVATPADP
jgi:hydrogenase maturation protease